MLLQAPFSDVANSNRLFLYDFLLVFSIFYQHLVDKIKARLTLASCLVCTWLIVEICWHRNVTRNSVTFSLAGRGNASKPYLLAIEEVLL